MTALLIANISILGFLALIWRADTLLNSFIRMVLIGSAFWNAFVLLQQLGYVVKI